MRLPGDRRRELRAVREREGCPIDDSTHRELAALASELGLDLPSWLSKDGFVSQL